MNTYLKEWMDFRSLDAAQAQLAMKSLLDGATSGAIAQEQIAACLMALRMKGESVPELVGFARELIARSIAVNGILENAIDTCGTGGDGSGTFNISTAAAFVLVSGGVPVAKHGNRSVSSRCGSADVIEALRVPLYRNPELARESLKRSGFAFLFAPEYHPALAAVGPVRRAMAVRTVFNMLGPLLNPARVRRQVVGVFHPDLCVPIAQVLRELGSKEALVLSSESGMDEISLGELTHIAHLKNGEISTYNVSPVELGLCPDQAKPSFAELGGGDAQYNAQLIEEILKGRLDGAKSDVVAVNAAAGFLVAGKCLTLKEGYVLAQQLIKVGKPYEALEMARRGV